MEAKTTDENHEAEGSKDKTGYTPVAEPRRPEDSFVAASSALTDGRTTFAWWEGRPHLSPDCYIG